MGMTFEFEVGSGFHFADAFGAQFEMPVANDKVYLPKALGNGYIQEIELRNGFGLCIHQYSLKQSFVLKRKAGKSSEQLTVKFDGRRLPLKSNGVPGESLFTNTSGCEVEFGTANFFSELTVPPDQQILFIVIGTTREALMNSLNLGTEAISMARMLRNNKSFMLQERLSPEMERALKQLSQITPTAPLAHLVYETKTQELIYLLFLKLLARQAGEAVMVNPTDVATLYSVRAAILNDLSIVPELPKLAADACMSQSKLKQLFNQIFGQSIYNYYQAERMDKAASLLHYFSVSETGYKVGFTNLSHFTQLFEKHHHIKPKKYKDSMKISSKLVQEW